MERKNAMNKKWVLWWKKKTRLSSRLVLDTLYFLFIDYIWRCVGSCSPQNHSKPQFLVRKKPAKSIPTFLLLPVSACLSWPSPTRIFQWKAKTTWVCWWYTQYSLVSEYKMHTPSLFVLREEHLYLLWPNKKQRRWSIELLGILHSWRRSSFQVQETRKTLAPSPNCVNWLDQELSHYYQFDN